MDEYVEPFGVGLHYTVLDAVVYHLYEMSGARRSGSKITLFGSAADFFTAGCPFNIPDARRQRLKNRFELLKCLFFGSDHETVAAFEAPHSATHPGVDVVDVLLLELSGPAYIVLVKAVAAVDDGIVALHRCGQALHRRFRRISRRNHHPDCARL